MMAECSSHLLTELLTGPMDLLPLVLPALILSRWYIPRITLTRPPAVTSQTAWTWLNCWCDTVVDFSVLQICLNVSSLICRQGENSSSNSELKNYSVYSFSVCGTNCPTMSHLPPPLTRSAHLFSLAFECAQIFTAVWSLHCLFYCFLPHWFCLLSVRFM